MITGAVICEFNPFHKGHKYLLEQMKKDGCDCIVAIMSGSFTQRGDVAVFSKFSRTRSALRCGANIVIELPAVWATSSAQRFAKGGCDIIRALGGINRVYFGSECGNIGLLKAAADATEDIRVQEITKALMEQGEYYPSAVQKAVREIYGDDISDILSSPNNTLGLEYIKSLKDTDIDLRTVTRAGAGHHSTLVSDGFASASLIRERIREGDEYKGLLPCLPDDIDNPAFTQQGDRALLLRLRQMSPEEYENIPDVSEGLHNRIYEAARKCNTSEEILEKVKTKRYTHSRLRRILTCALLGITKDMQKNNVPYIRVLGFDPRGEEFLKIAKNSCALPFVINVAAGYAELLEDAREIFDIDIKATDIRTIFEKTPSPCGEDFTSRLIKI